MPRPTHSDRWYCQQDPFHHKRLTIFIDAQAVIGPFTIHQFLQILAGACGILAIVISIILFAQHAFNIRNPREQIKIMRIISIVPIFTALSYACLCLGQSAIYLTMWMEVWEAICVCTFFLLVLTYIHPDPDSQVAYFANLPLMDKKKQIVPGSSCAAFYKRARMFIFQMLPALTVLAIIQCVTEALKVFCINSNKPVFAHIWITVLKGFSTGAAIMVVIRFCTRLKSELPDRSIWSQLFAFKSIIGLNFLQSFGFSIAAGEITPTATLSYNDISIGIPNALIIIEMVAFALAFHKFYSHKSYKAGGVNALSTQPQMNPLLAMAKALNPLEVLEGVFAAFTGKAGGKRAYQMQSYGMQNHGSHEDLVDRPAQAHKGISHDSLEEQRATAPTDGQGYYAQGGRVGAYSPPSYGRG